MFLYKQIVDLLGRQILDYRGNPAIEVEILCEDGVIGKASMSCTQFSPNVSRISDFDYTEEIVHLINTDYADALIGENVLHQVQIDRILDKMWNTSNKSNIQKCVIQTISMAAARTASLCIGFPLFRYLGGIGAYRLPGVLVRIYNCTNQEQQQLKMTGISIVVDKPNLMEKVFHLQNDFYKKISDRMKESFDKNYSIAILLDHLRNVIEKEDLFEKQTIQFAIHKESLISSDPPYVEIVRFTHEQVNVLTSCVLGNPFLTENTVTETLKKARDNQNMNFLMMNDLIKTEDCFLLDLAAASGAGYIDLGIKGNIENAMITNQLIRILEHF